MDSVLDLAALTLAGGGLICLRAALEPLAEGDRLGVRGEDPSLAHDLRAWCRVAGHACEGERDGVLWIRKGPHRDLAGGQEPDWGLHMPLRNGRELDTRDWMQGRVGEVPTTAPERTGFSPRGAVVEPGVPDFDFRITERDSVWAAEVAELYEQATASQWDASRDIPWDRLEPLPEPLERAVCQIMTFLTENEYSALYVPAKFVPQIHPHFNEVVMFLATQMMDEARHIEAFTKRALANGGGLQVSAASTQLSLKSLFDQHDFTSASFLLSVMGEGTFLDLLHFIERHAPDPVTAEICRRARADEARHVRFGIAHVRYFLAQDPGHAGELLDSVRRRADMMAAVTEVTPRVQEALAVLAAGGLDPRRLGAGVEKVRDLVAEMHEHRRRRLVMCGFSQQQADEMSALHTPNFM